MTLSTYSLLQYFNCIVGYEEVGLQKQKPAPDGLLKCIKMFSEIKEGRIFYIGDHETDIHSASNANQALTNGMSKIKIICIGAFYGSNVDTSDWSVRPDYEAHQVSDILNIINIF